jgi:hypothetical protein
MKAIVPGDTIVVTKLDRLARFEPGLASNSRVKPGNAGTVCPQAENCRHAAALVAARSSAVMIGDKARNPYSNGRVKMGLSAIAGAGLSSVDLGERS